MIAFQQEADFQSGHNLQLFERERERERERRREREGEGGREGEREREIKRERERLLGPVTVGYYSIKIVLT